MNESEVKEVTAQAESTAPKQYHSSCLLNTTDAADE